MTPMTTLTLPGTTLSLSRLCLGTARFGADIPESAAFELLDQFVERGGNFLDSAHIYAAWLPGGTGASERTVGRWVRARDCRSKVVVATKGGHPELNTMHISRLSPECIRKDLHESLQRLQMDAVELYWLHRDDPQIPVGEIMSVLNELVAGGRVRAVGCSNWTVARIQESAAYASRNSTVGFCASQIGWSVAEAAQGHGVGGMLYMDVPTLAFHRESRMPQVAYSSQAGGIFNKGALRAPYDNPRNQTRLTLAQSLAAKHGCSPNQIALAWLLAQQFPVFPIIGSRTVEQIADSCAAVNVRLSAEELRALETAQH